MAYSAYIGVSGKARKIKNIYIGVNGKARRVARAYVGVGGKARKFWGIVPTRSTLGALDNAMSYGAPYHYSWAETKNHIIMIVGTDIYIDDRDGTWRGYYSKIQRMISIDKATLTATYFGMYYSNGCIDMGCGRVGDGALFVGGSVDGDYSNLGNKQYFFNDSLTKTQFKDSRLTKLSGTIVVPFSNGTSSMYHGHGSGADDALIQIIDSNGTISYEMIPPREVTYGNYSAMSYWIIVNGFSGKQKTLIAFSHSGNLDNATVQGISYMTFDQSATYVCIKTGKLGTGTATDWALDPPATGNLLDNGSMKPFPGSCRVGDKICYVGTYEQSTSSKWNTAFDIAFGMAIAPSGTFSYFTIAAGTAGTTRWVSHGTVNAQYSLIYFPYTRYSGAAYQSHYTKGFSLDAYLTAKENTELTNYYKESPKYTNDEEAVESWYRIIQAGNNWMAMLSTDEGCYIQIPETMKIAKFTGA